MTPVVDLVHHFGHHEYAKEVHIPAGIELGQHVHPYSHLSILAQGEAIVTVEGLHMRRVAPVCILIPAGVAHKVKAVTDVVWFCIHGTDDKNPNTVDQTILTRG